MRNKNLLKSILLMFIAFLFSCEDHSLHQAQHGTDHSVNAIQKTDSTSMPGMNHQHHDHSGMLHLTKREQLLAGIQIDTVRMKIFRNSISLLAEVVADENTVSAVSAKVKGRINKLHLRNPGEVVRKGQALYDIYSETLYAEQQEFILLINTAQPENILDGLRKKLLLHGLTIEQIALIESRKKAMPEITIYCSQTGFLSRLNVSEGDYVETGQLLFEISSLDVVQVNARVYPGEINTFGKATSYEVEIGTVPGKQFSAIKIFDNPSLENNSKILLVRLRVNNSDHLLRPGMMTTVNAVTDSERLLLVPKSALIMEAGMFFIWVQEREGMFSRRMIHTGKENEYEIEVLSGLAEGDRIVSNGSYLLNSEHILRKGVNSMGGMPM